MEKYLTFEVEDYIIDDSFIRWVIGDSEEDNRVWSEWLQNYPHLCYKVEQAKDIVASIRFNKVEKVSDEEISSFIELIKATHLPRVPHIEAAEKSVYNLYSRKWFAVAASLVFGTLLVVSLILNSKEQKIKSASNSIVFIEKVNTGSSPVLIYMADSSLVILKPKSTLKYPKSFLTAATREVFLSGEAFFEVHKNANKPFLVHSGKMTTRVLGTSFTIKAYNGEDFKVLVNSGKVHVYSEDGSSSYEKSAIVEKSVTLLPNQQVTLKKDNSKLIKEMVLESTILSKPVTRKMFDFKGTPVTQVLNTLREAYQVDILFNERQFSMCSLTASLYDDQLVDKLAIICKAIDANFSINNGQIAIEGQGCNP